jgi:Tfp pilus assembly protein PilX
MKPIALAKVRARRRRREEGAAMFLVSMTIAVLASVGIYALSAASLEVRTSGNERQSTQTHYLAEYGVIGAMHELTATKAQFYMGLMITNPDTCLSLPGVASADPVTKACRRLPDTELGQQWTPGAITVAYSSAPLTPGVSPGSFGATPMAGHFFVELTDPVQLSAPSRYATDLNFCFIQLTATSTGITQPYQLLTDPVAQFSGEGLEMQRARIVAGPVQCPR